MTLISAYNSDGCIGRCDAKCHDANSPASECDCICGGMNHGAGQKRAIENTQKYCDQWIENWKQRNPTHDVVTNQEVFQLSLF